MEAAVLLHIEKTGAVKFDDPAGTLERLNTIMAQVARQTDRTDEQIKLQQFSTPPTEAFAVVRAAGDLRGVTVLEPSAGTGSLAVMARIAGAHVVTNEIAPRRRALLEAMGFETHAVDAELLDGTLPTDVKPQVIVISVRPRGYQAVAG